MEWEAEAEAVIRRAPFFVRRFARKRIEEMVRAEGGTVVTAEACRRARGKFADEANLRGDAGRAASAPDAPPLSEVEACAGPERDCPFALTEPHGLSSGVEELLDRLDYDRFALEHYEGMILPHHRLKVAVCACPNGCTQPQIKDIGLMARSSPQRTHEDCTQCGLCVEACPDGAVSLTGGGPMIDPEACVHCGACARACPAGTLVEGRRGFEVMVAGRLGRHPRLAQVLGPGPVPGREEALAVVERLVRAFMAESLPNERFGAFAERVGLERLEALALGERGQDPERAWG